MTKVPRRVNADGAGKRGHFPRAVAVISGQSRSFPTISLMFNKMYLTFVILRRYDELIKVFIFVLFYLFIYFIYYYLFHFLEW